MISQIQNNSGFCLDRFELFNWGTFNKNIWVMDTQGKTSLLTGKNGSGKSTLVDALITLLVPNKHNMRNYNYAAGEGKKSERTEKSYVEGAYAQGIDIDTGGKQQTLKLRPNDTYTILLASFVNQTLNKTVTLAQVLWKANGEFGKFNIIADKQLSIREHFQLPPSGKIADLKLQLRKQPEITIYDTFKDYVAKIVRLFHLRSEKALSLFNQIVSIKEIGNLNEFVRQHMLEDEDVRENIDTLRKNYQDLTIANEAIIKARKQHEMLSPIVKEGANYCSYTERINDLERQLIVLPFFFDNLTIQLLEVALSKIQKELDLAIQHSAQKQAELELQKQQHLELFAALQNDTANRRIEELKRELEQAKARRKEKERALSDYHRLTEQLELPNVSTVEEFMANQSHAEQQYSGYEAQIDEVRATQEKLTIQKHNLDIEIKDLASEISQLKERNSQIPNSELRIRSLICDKLQIQEGELPFVGELLQVRDREHTWEAAIQRLLNGFARQLLVPEHLYKRVRSFVNQTNLGGRLIYHRCSQSSGHVSDSQLRAESVFHKLLIRPETPYENWLKDRLIRHYDYICCAELEQFDKEERAITPQGQMKHGGNHYEKDDRRGLMDRINYALGWNNERKIKALKETLHELESEHQQASMQLDTAQAQEKHVRGLSRKTEDLLKFVDWARLDAHSENQNIHQYQSEIDHLQASSDTYKTLEKQYEEATQRLSTLEMESRKIDEAITTHRNKVDEYQKQSSNCRNRLKSFDVNAHQSDFNRIETDLPPNLTVDDLNDVRRALEEKYRNSRQSTSGQQTRIKNAIEDIMQAFFRAYPQDTEDVDARIESLDWYLKRINQLEKDDLPAHEERFDKLLNNNIRQSITIFRSDLEQRESAIKTRIDELNRSLGQISYTNTTYIKLIAKDSQNKEIREFRNLLNNSYGNIGILDDDENKEEDNKRVFANIIQLIDRFEKDARWTKDVTDVRNWLDFSAEERLMSDHSIHEYYQSSSGKSGGQKAKLAYTILASAIADQYGLNDPEKRANTFRFVVIDEVFSKSDEANSRFAMDLFKQLGLQVLVVTPADKIQIVEPYIGSCHLVQNNEQGNSSQLTTITIEQLRDLREQDIKS